MSEPVWLRARRTIAEAASGERLGTRVWPALALVAVLAWSAYLVAAQPVTSPWWTYADADATYTATALNLTYGNSHARYLDHPGLPLHELLATSFEVERLVRRVGGDGPTESAFFTEKMLNLDETRPLYRGWAILFFLLGAAASFFTAQRLLGHWAWGLAAGLLWTAAPGLLAMSIQYRPDVPLGLLVVVTAYLIVRAAQTRSGTRYLGAAALLGLSMTVKLHAAGLLVPLALAALWRPPLGGWWERTSAELVDLARRRRAFLVAGAIVWLVLAIAFNRPRVPFTITSEQRSLILNAAALLAIYGAACVAVQRWESLRFLRPVFRPFYAALALAVAAGILLPASIVLDDGLQMLVVIRRGLTGGGINEEIAAFSAPLDQLKEFPLRQAMFVFLLAAVAAVFGLRRRDPVPVVLFTGAAVLGVMAQARLATTHYFAPAYLAAVPAALWLFRTRGDRAHPSLFVWPVVAYVVLAQFHHRTDAEGTTASFAAREAPALELVEKRLQPGEVGLVPSYWPHPDSRYFEVVALYVEHTPEYPYRFLPDLPQGAAFASERGLRPRYFVGPVAASVIETGPLQLVTGTYTARRIPGVPDAVELLSGAS